MPAWFFRHPRNIPLRLYLRLYIRTWPMFDTSNDPHACRTVYPAPALRKVVDLLRGPRPLKITLLQLKPEFHDLRARCRIEREERENRENTAEARRARAATGAAGDKRGQAGADCSGDQAAKRQRTLGTPSLSSQEPPREYLVHLRSLSSVPVTVLDLAEDATLADARREMEEDGKDISGVPSNFHFQYRGCACAIRREGARMARDAAVGANCLVLLLPSAPAAPTAPSDAPPPPTSAHPLLPPPPSPPPPPHVTPPRGSSTNVSLAATEGAQEAQDGPAIRLILVSGVEYIVRPIGRGGRPVCLLDLKRAAIRVVRHANAGGTSGSTEGEEAATKVWASMEEKVDTGEGTETELEVTQPELARLDLWARSIEGCTFRLGIGLPDDLELFEAGLVREGCCPIDAVADAHSAHSGGAGGEGAGHIGGTRRGEGAWDTVYVSFRRVGDDASASNDRYGVATAWQPAAPAPRQETGALSDFLAALEVFVDKAPNMVAALGAVGVWPPALCAMHRLSKNQSIDDAERTAIASAMYRLCRALQDPGVVPNERSFQCASKCFAFLLVRHARSPALDEEEKDEEKNRGGGDWKEGERRGTSRQIADAAMEEARGSEVGEGIDESSTNGRAASEAGGKGGDVSMDNVEEKTGQGEDRAASTRVTGVLPSSPVPFKEVATVSVSGQGPVQVIQLDLTCALTYSRLVDPVLLPDKRVCSRAAALEWVSTESRADLCQGLKPRQLWPRRLPQLPWLQPLAEATAATAALPGASGVPEANNTGGQGSGHGSGAAPPGGGGGGEGGRMELVPLDALKTFMTTLFSGATSVILIRDLAHDVFRATAATRDTVARRRTRIQTMMEEARVTSAVEGASRHAVQGASDMLPVAALSLSRLASRQPLLTLNTSRRLAVFRGMQPCSTSSHPQADASAAHHDSCRHPLAPTLLRLASKLPPSAKPSNPAKTLHRAAWMATSLDDDILLYFTCGFVIVSAG